MKGVFTRVWALLLFAGALTAQTPAAKSILGSVTEISGDKTEFQVKADGAAPVSVRVLPATVVQKIAPGETNLKNAVNTTFSEVAVGDRVLASISPTDSSALRIVLMAAGDIARRDEADRLDWAKRGVSGIVASMNAAQIVLKAKNPAGAEIQQTISISGKTNFRRYAADSVKFADAKASKVEEVRVGDQLRARGDRSSDGIVSAEDVVFGTFLTKAGTVVNVDASAKTITVKELGTEKPLTIRLTADSQIKKAAAPRAGNPAAAAPNINQMIEAMPPGNIGDIQPGTSIIVSSTKGSQSDEVTAIVLVSNAEAIIRLATGQRGRGGVLTFGSGGGGGLDILSIPGGR